MSAARSRHETRGLSTPGVYGTVVSMHCVLFLFSSFFFSGVGSQKEVFFSDPQFVIVFHPDLPRSTRAAMPLIWDDTVVPHRGELTFVHYFHDSVAPSELCKKEHGSPFKSKILRVDYLSERIIYTVQDVTDGFTHETHISDFVSMEDDSYPHMKNIVCADAKAHAVWLRVC